MKLHTKMKKLVFKLRTAALACFGKGSNAAVKEDDIPAKGISVELCAMGSDTIKAFRQDPRDPSTPGCALQSQNPALTESLVEKFSTTAGNDDASNSHDDAGDARATAGASIDFDEICELLGGESPFSHLVMDDGSAQSSVVYSLDDLPDIEGISDWEFLQTPIMDLEELDDDVGHFICPSISAVTQGASSTVGISDAWEEGPMDADIGSIGVSEEPWYIV